MADTAMTAGLLHDVGKLVLASGLGDNYRELMGDAKNKAEPLWQLEQESLGASHAEVGAYLLSLWALPDAIVDVVAYHHRPGEVTDQGGVPLTAVHVANGFAHQCVGDPVTLVDHDYLERCGLDGRYEDWEQTCLSRDDERPGA